jgi:hypothetical protein
LAFAFAGYYALPLTGDHGVVPVLTFAFEFAFSYTDIV